MSLTARMNTYEDKFLLYHRIFIKSHRSELSPTAIGLLLKKHIFVYVHNITSLTTT